MPSVGELFIELGVVADTKEFEEFEKKAKKAKNTAQEYADAIRKKIGNSTKQTEKDTSSLTEKMGGFVKGLAGVKIAIIGAVYAINRLSESLIANNQTWVNFTRTTDLSLQSLQKYAGVASLLDKSLGAEGAAGSIAQLNKRLFELRLTGEGAKGFQLAGINPIGLDAFGVLEQIRMRIQGMDDTTATYLLEQMGLDARLIAMLRLGREEFEDLGKIILRYQLTDKQRQQIQKMNTQISIATTKLQYLKDRAILAIMPYWVKFIESTARVAEGLARFVKMLTHTKTGILALAGAIISVLIPAIGLLYKAITAHPIVAIITAILGALWLLIDDIMVYFQGGDSVLGLLMNTLDDINIKLNSIETPEWLKSLLKLAESAGNISQMMQTIQNAKDGKLGDVDINKSIKGFVESPFSWAMFPTLAPFGYASRFWSSMLNPTSQTNSVSYHNDNRQVNMNNLIHTNEAANAVAHNLDLLYANNYANA